MVGRNPEKEAKRGVGLNTAGPWATVTQNRRGAGGWGWRGPTTGTWPAAWGEGNLLSWTAGGCGPDSTTLPSPCPWGPKSSRRGEGVKQSSRVRCPWWFTFAGGWRGYSPSSSCRRLRVQSGMRRPPASSPTPLPLSPRRPRSSTAAGSWCRGGAASPPPPPPPSASQRLTLEAAIFAQAVRTSLQYACVAPAQTVTRPSQLISVLPPPAPPSRMYFSALPVVFSGLPWDSAFNRLAGRQALLPKRSWDMRRMSRKMAEARVHAPRGEPAPQPVAPLSPARGRWAGQVVHS